MVAKLCTVCRLELPLTRFYPDKRAKSDYRAHCKACQSAANAARNSDPQVAAAARERSKLWRTQNPERAVSQHAAWRDLPENKAKRAATEANRRANKAAVGGEVTDAEFAALKEATGNVCLCCGISGDEVTLARDHVIPLILGGPNTVENLQPLCKICNSRKGVKSTDYRIK